MSECIQIQILYKYEFEGKNISLRGNIMSDAKPLWWLNYMALYKLRKNKNSSKNNKYFFYEFYWNTILSQFSCYNNGFSMSGAPVITDL